MKEEKKEETVDIQEEMDEFGYMEIKAEPIENPDGSTFTPWQCFLDEVEKTENTPAHVQLEVYLYSEILEPFVYAELIHIIRSLGRDDKVTIHINSNGGDIYTLIAFIQSFESSKAYITTEVDGTASSAAAILAFSTDKIIVGEYSSYMWHNVQNFMMGAMDNAKQIVSNQHFGKVYEKLLRKFCSKVLTYTEIDDIINKGIEVWLTSDEVKKRLNVK